MFEDGAKYTITSTGGKSSEFLANNFDELDNAFFDEFITFSPANDGLPDPDFSEQSDSKYKSSETLLGSLHDVNAQDIEDNWQGDPWAFRPRFSLARWHTR
ncbi:hypothetical protein DID88_009495 [Monilinia fructigena]|uniref:Uncharacterized protein n=1 Tax=Monilinia fructigena TaxID=38457 RepID=A0A395IM53_9HELO|nr:hypothetical protein DID88_009495 [Monilinia fructigena]